MITEQEFASNLSSIEKRISDACRRSGRDRSEVTLIAVSKNNPAEAVSVAAVCGLDTFGENRVREMCQKQDELGGRYNWHLIGRLQTNKVKKVIGRAVMIHSVDSCKLAAFIDSESAKAGVVTDILVEVNIGGEESKGGVSPDKTEELVDYISSLKNVRLRGLMTVAPPVPEPSKARPYFRKMRDLLVDINNKNYDNIHMDVLSMGMSGDFETAVEEGATHVRIGTSLFGARDYGQHF